MPRRVAGTVAVASLGAVLAVGGWWAMRPAGPAPARLADHDAAGGAPSPSVAPAGDAMARVARLAGRQDSAAVSELIDLYRQLAGNPEALEARKAAFRSLLGQPDVRVGLAAALTAIAADPTPKAQDPMWPYLVQEIAQLWDAVTIDHGRDLVMLEERPKPKDVLVESLADVPPGKLSDSQRANLAADLIDLYPRLRADQKPAMDRALTTLGGSDLVEILGRRGLAEDDYLEAAIEERRAQQAARAALGVPRASER